MRYIEFAVLRVAAYRVSNVLSDTKFCYRYILGVFSNFDSSATQLQDYRSTIPLVPYITHNCVRYYY